MNLDARINALAVELRERGTIPCALLGRMVRDTECCSRGLATTVEEYQVCRSCPEGQRLAATAPLWGFCKALPAPVVYTPPQAAPKPAYRPAPSRAVRPAKPVVMGVDLGKPGGDKTVEVALAVGAKGAVALSFREITPKAPHPMMAMQEGQTAQQAKLQAEPKAPRPERQAKPVATCRECGWIKPRRCSWPEPDLCGSCAPTAQPVRPKHLVKAAAKRTATPAPVQVPEAQLTPPVMDTRLVKLASALRELTADGRMRVSMLDLMHSIGAANYDEAAGLVIHAGLRTSQLSGPVQTVLVDHTARLLMASEVRQ